LLIFKNDHIDFLPQFMIYNIY